MKDGYMEPAAQGDLDAESEVHVPLFNDASFEPTLFLHFEKSECSQEKSV
jgi:hypothetical protein